jgi:hypothetical protein
MSPNVCIILLANTPRPNFGLVQMVGGRHGRDDINDVRHRNAIVACKLFDRMAILHPEVSYLYTETWSKGFGVLFGHGRQDTRSK